MADHPFDLTSGGRSRSLGQSPADDTSPDPASDPSSDRTQAVLPDRIGHYAIGPKLGEGGMGVVYAARDERLQRTVAIKIMASAVGDDTARRRFWREARAAASVNHPHVCQIYEIGEAGGTLFIAMELLQGEVLTERLRHGPLAVPDAVNITLEILAALSALHAGGVVHRDLKPSNVFLTAHGVKLLDFGLARPEAADAPGDDGDLTRAGVVMGTPRYMAPEQATGSAADARSDLFAAGAILFELLAGRPAFAGATIMEVLHATRYEHPPALSGSPAVAAVDRVIRRALAKQPADRPASAEAMAAELRAVHGLERTDTLNVAQALTRLVVLPFRVLRADPETDFLAFSLPDAITTSLSGIGTLVLRSSAAAARFAGATPDLQALARDADVDRVVMGTLVRAGDELRVSTQLVETPSGTLIASHTVQSSLGDLFALQDDIARRVVDALSLPLTGGSGPMTPRDMPHDGRAYELYLRGNELARTYDGLAAARELYQQSLDLDSRFAPAWAGLGRCHRVIGKYVDGAADSETRAEEAFRRALALNPRHTLTHKFYAGLEADIGQSIRAVVRLLGEASRHGNDPELFAGLVHACRYAGLYEPSIAAHAEARRLDPHIPTSLEQTLLVAGDLTRLLAVEPPAVIAGADDGIRVIALGLAGRRDEARRKLAVMRERSRLPAFEAWTDYLTAWLDRRAQDMDGRVAKFRALKIQDDPEAIFQEGWMACELGRDAHALDYLERAVAKGYYAAPTLTASPHFDRLRDDVRFQALLAAAEAGRERALAAFRDAGGERLLGA